MVFFKTMYSIIELLFLSYLPGFVAWLSIRFPVSDLFAHELPQARRVQSTISNPIHRNCILYRFQILCLASVGSRLRLHFLLAFHPCARGHAGLLCIVANFAPRGTAQNPWRSSHALNRRSANLQIKENSCTTSYTCVNLLLCIHA